MTADNSIPHIDYFGAELNCDPRGGLESFIDDQLLAHDKALSEAGGVLAGLEKELGSRSSLFINLPTFYKNSPIMRTPINALLRFFYFCINRKGLAASLKEDVESCANTKKNYEFLQVEYAKVLFGFERLLSDDAEAMADFTGKMVLLYNNARTLLDTFGRVATTAERLQIGYEQVLKETGGNIK